MKRPPPFIERYSERLAAQPRPLRAVARAFPRPGDLACGGRFVELDCGHVVVVTSPRAARAKCRHCATDIVVSDILADYLGPHRLAAER